MRAGVCWVALCLSTAAFAQEGVTQTYGETAKNMAAEVRLGAYYPGVDRGLGGAGTPYASNFGNGPMLLGELEIDRQLFTSFGSLGIGLLAGYAEKYGKAVDGSGNATSETTSLQVVPLKALIIYRFDVLYTKWNVPLVPYVKGGFALTHWWASKGGSTEVVEGLPGVGWSYGLAGMGGLMFLLDVLDPRLARDFDTSIGVNHSYLFAEFNYTWQNNFGARYADGTPRALDLSSAYWMFGLAFEY